ncbi:hypothetical protein FXO89_23090 [Salmonella enterica]|nr:hypothetical protein [Salmonella enterica]
MKKPIQPYDLELPEDADYKQEAIHERDKANFESLEKWVYLGADIRNPSYAKIGITMGDLTKRSYSSANPNYYLYCAFKCQSYLKKEQLKEIEKDVLKYLDSVYCWEDDRTKRVPHYESGILSECYFDIEFAEFFEDLHSYLLQTHIRHFVITGICGDDGYHLDCIFNKHIPLSEQYRLRNSITHYH